MRNTVRLVCLGLPDYKFLLKSIPYPLPETLIKARDTLVSWTFPDLWINSALTLTTPSPGPNWASEKSLKHT